jgi:hypothetical protein
MGQGEHLRPWDPGDDIVTRLRRYQHPEMCNVSDMLLHDIEAAVVEIIRLRSGSTTMDKNETRADPDLNISRWTPGPWLGWRRFTNTPVGGEHYVGPEGMEIFCSPSGFGHRAQGSPPSTRPWWGRKGDVFPMTRDGRLKVFATPDAVLAALRNLDVGKD